MKIPKTFTLDGYFQVSYDPTGCIGQAYLPSELLEPGTRFYQQRTSLDRDSEFGTVLKDGWILFDGDKYKLPPRSVCPWGVTQKDGNWFTAGHFQARKR